MSPEAAEGDKVSVIGDFDYLVVYEGEIISTEKHIYSEPVDLGSMKVILPPPPEKKPPLPEEGLPIPGFEVISVIVALLATTLYMLKRRLP